MPERSDETGQPAFVAMEVSSGRITGLSQSSGSGKDQTIQHKERTTDVLETFFTPAGRAGFGEYREVSLGRESLTIVDGRSA
ncbi:hypothetical protein RRSWK_01397 [Rhodopirellula sp. SWK7]|nr:hypothetical protein RRSWK_01397 [Rhodopirellula sp. SWK7]